jgi:NADP-dependent aldehyde dehydrogenase
VAGALAEQSGQTMLTSGIEKAYEDGIAGLEATPGVTVVARGTQGTTANAPAPLLLATNAAVFAATEHLQNEVFGSAALLVRYKDLAQLRELAEKLEGQLTATVQYDDGDQQAARTLLPILERRVGRILFNGWPTGVEVGHSMVHGGPFPATSDSRTTSVGSLAIYRFQRPVSYQNIPDDLLPEPLQDANPWKLPRRIDGAVVPA